jgi:hypothetical protein
VSWQPDLKDMLRGLAKDYDEVADDIENGATEIPPRRASRRVIACLSVDLCK